MIHVLGEYNSVFNEFVREIRDQEIQKDSMRFRRNMERAAQIMAYEISKTLHYSPTQVQTSLGTAEVNMLDDELVLATILRAGLTMHNGMLNFFDKAENAFISAYRKHESDGSFEIVFEYISSPSIENKVLILADPMLATGGSILLAYKALLDRGQPKHTHIAALISSREGVEFLQKNIGEANFTLWTGAIDDELTAHSYIVPGLGDAGDLAFGSKL